MVIRTFINKKNIYSSKHFDFQFLIFFYLCLYFTPQLLAKPADGVGLAFEGGSLKPIHSSTEKNFNSSNYYGISFDYQWRIRKNYTFSLLGFERGGIAKRPPHSEFEYYKLGFVGAEFRAWIGFFFIGIHGGRYLLTWIEDLNSYSEIGYEDGTGYGMGIETGSGIFVAVYSEESRDIKFENMQNQKLYGNRFILGYRWF